MDAFSNEKFKEVIYNFTALVPALSRSTTDSVTADMAASLRRLDALRYDHVGSRLDSGKIQRLSVSLSLRV